jgi:ring-1,2-phenylacetyl-CoA epoxidase subunit PaaC
MSTASVNQPVEKAAALSEQSRGTLRALILSLADSKRLLGIRYSDWMLGAPTLETGIAASSMAQDEWGHSRLTYALLSEFGDEPKRLEHEREAEEYHSIAALDSAFASWSEMIAAALLLDTAITEQYAALAESRYTPLHNRVQKLLDEEEFHFQYAAGWAPKLAASAEARAQFVKAARGFLPAALHWLGRGDDPALARLREEGLTRGTSDELRRSYLARVGPVLEEGGVAGDLGVQGGGDGWSFDGALEWSDWDDRRRRSGGGGPDADTLARVRGDKNRAMLLD